MKKIVLAAVLAVLLLTGCGSSNKKEIRCVISQTQSGVVISAKLNIDVTNKKISYMNAVYDMDLSSYTEAQIEQVSQQDLCSSLNSLFSSFGTGANTCTKKVDGKHIVINNDFDISKLSSQYQSEIDDIDEFVSGIEKSGFKCTVN